MPMQRKRGTRVEIGGGGGIRLKLSEIEKIAMTFSNKIPRL